MAYIILFWLQNKQQGYYSNVCIMSLLTKPSRVTSNQFEPVLQTAKFTSRVTKCCNDFFYLLHRMSCND